MNELEKRLRELHDSERTWCCSPDSEDETPSYDCIGMDRLLAAARIGAEIEREECAETPVARSHLSIEESKAWHLGIRDLQYAIRARGAK